MSCYATILFHEGDDFACPDWRVGGADVGVGNGVDGGQATADVAAAEYVEPVVDGSNVGGVNGVAIEGGRIARAGTHPARVVVCTANASLTIVCLVPPNAEGEGVVNVCLP